uniref:C-type lectin domain-containing protein n=1 Tax=Poecilia mexicana TaxID=48701 RepID=A0A3B3WY16_9TELE
MSFLNHCLNFLNMHALFCLFFTLLAIRPYCICLSEQVNLLRRSVECPTDWTAINDRCFRYIADVKTWAAAEKHCLYLGANLASVHSQEDNHHLQTLIFTATRKSNKQPVHFGQPNNAFRLQHCIQMNYSKKKCWDDVKCSTLLPSICVKKNSPPKGAEA